MVDLTSTWRERVAALSDGLRPDGFDALLLYGAGSTLGPASRSQGTMRYLCGWDGHHNPSIVVLRPGREPTLLVGNVFSTFLARDHFWIGDIRLAPGAALGTAAGELCGGTQARRVATLGRSEMTVAVSDALQAACPAAEWLDVSGPIEQARAVKSPAEIAGHEAAAAVCDAMFETLAREIRDPRPAFQLQAEMERVARRSGCEYVMTWLTVGPEADYSRFWKEECRRVPRVGDQVIAGIYLILDGFWGHAIRTGGVGEPSPSHRRAYGVARAMQDAMAAELKVGQDLREVQGAAERILLDAFSSSELARAFRFRDAHGLGYSYEDPVVSAAFPQPYAKQAVPAEVLALSGMLLELHPNVFVSSLGGACLGDMVTVADTGPRFLTRFPRDWIDWTAS